MKKIFVKPEIVVMTLQYGNIMTGSVDGFKAVQDDATTDNPISGGNGNNEARGQIIDDILLY